MYGAPSVSPPVLPQHTDYSNGHNNPDSNVFSCLTDKELETQGLY